MRAKNPMRRSWLDTEADDGGWVAIRLKLMVSPSWRHRPIPLCRLLERIEIEHLRHKGHENGHLCVSYGQLVDYGVSRRVIRPAIAAGQRLGLLDVSITDDGTARRQRTTPRADRMEPPNLYRLTYLPAKGKRAPSDEWASISEDRALEIVAEFQNATGSKTKSQSPFPQDASSLSCTETPSTSSLSGRSPVPERELSTISAGTPSKAERHRAQPPTEAPPPKGRDGRRGQADEPVHIGDAAAAVLAAAMGAK